MGRGGEPTMKLSDATRLSALVKAYQKRLRQVESVQRRTARLLDALDDDELTQDVMAYFETVFDETSDTLATAFASMRRQGGETPPGDSVGKPSSSDGGGRQGRPGGRNGGIRH
jgi:hypothetical protein